MKYCSLCLSSCFNYPFLFFSYSTYIIRSFKFNILCQISNKSLWKVCSTCYVVYKLTCTCTLLCVHCGTCTCIYFHVICISCVTMVMTFRFLLSGSSCGDAHIWDTQNPQSPSTLLKGHTKEVTAVAWSPYQLDKVICSLKFWIRQSIIIILIYFKHKYVCR